MSKDLKKEIAQTWVPLVKLWFLMLMVILGIYTLPVTIFSHLFFHHPATGNLIVRDHHVIASTLYGQQFSNVIYFWGRPSMTFYQTDLLKPDNIHWTGSDFWKNFSKQQVYFWQQQGIQNPPKELLFPSSSQVDPHLSLEAMRLQIPRVAKARHLSEERLQSIIDKYIERPFLGIFGQTRVNVLKVNLDLDHESSTHS